MPPCPFPPYQPPRWCRGSQPNCALSSSFPSANEECWSASCVTRAPLQPGVCSEGAWRAAGGRRTCHRLNNLITAAH